MMNLHLEMAWNLFGQKYGAKKLNTERPQMNLIMVLCTNWTGTDRFAPCGWSWKINKDHRPTDNSKSPYLGRHWWRILIESIERGETPNETKEFSIALCKVTEIWLTVLLNFTYLFETNDMVRSSWVQYEDPLWNTYCLLSCRPNWKAKKRLLFEKQDVLL